MGGPFVGAIGVEKNRFLAVFCGWRGSLGRSTRGRRHLLHTTTFPSTRRRLPVPSSQKGLDRRQARQTRPSTSARNGQRHTTVVFTTTSQPSHVAALGHLGHVSYGPSFPFDFPIHWKPLKGMEVAFEREAKETKGKVGREQAQLGRDARRKRHVDGSAATERSCRLLRAF